MKLAAGKGSCAGICCPAFNTGPKALLPLLVAALALLGGLAFFSACAQAQSADAENLQQQLDEAKNQLDAISNELKAANNAVEDLKTDKNNLNIKNTALQEQLDKERSARESLEQQLENLPQSIKTQFSENGVDVRGLKEDAVPKGLFGNIRKILFQGRAYMPVSRWHLLPVLTLILLLAALLVLAGTMLLRPSKKSLKTRGNAYIGKSRSLQRPLPENAGKPASDISLLAEQGNEVARSLKLVLNILGAERERAHDSANSLNLQAQKLEQAIGSIGQAQENSMAALSKEINEKIQTLSRAIAANLAKQSQDFRQALSDKGLLAQNADWQANANALLTDIKQKVDALNAPNAPDALNALNAPEARAIMARLDRLNSQSATSLDKIRDDIEQVKALLESRFPQGGAQGRGKKDETVQTGEEMLMDMLKSR